MRGQYVAGGALYFIRTDHAKSFLFSYVNIALEAGRMEAGCPEISVYLFVFIHLAGEDPPIIL